MIKHFKYDTYTPLSTYIGTTMNKFLSLLSLLLVLSLTALSPAYADSHEKKADETVATKEKAEEAKSEKAEGDKAEAEAKDDEKKKEKKEGDDDEEPECD